MKPIAYLPLLLIFLCVLACGSGSDKNPVNTAPPANSANAGPSNAAGQGGKTSLDYMKEGNEVFFKKKYKESIEPYQKALDMEKDNPKLSKDLWHIMIDNLSIAYGITGDLKKSREVINYGISKDPDYPLFYYNLADTYGEENDEANAIANLKKAYERKANLIQGEKIPNPETDDSFQTLMKSDKFQKAVKDLK